MDAKVFNKENFDKLKQTCQQIISLSDENVDGQLMTTQLMLLANRINDFATNPIVNTSGCFNDNTMGNIVINNDAKTIRIEEEYQRVLAGIKDLANKGFDDFTMVVRGTYSEAYDVCDRLKEIGVHISERGFDHRGFGESAYANVHFYISKTE